MSTQAKPPSAMKMAVRTAVILFLFVVAFTGLLSAAYLWTLPTIEAAAAGEKMKLIDEVLPRVGYDNDLLKDTVQLQPAAALGQNETSIAYRARKNGEPAALVLEAVAPDGYAGKIRLLIAFAADGAVLGVRVTQHKETPGLGDYVEPQKDKNKEHPWITQFDGLNPGRIDAREWKVKKDGGRFDSVAGATVTPRAVIKAVRKAALYVEENRQQLFAPARGEAK
ncbi:MAG: electron transport complex, RnfABCDGE type, subunit [Proteobacteria bacterium]|nr:electron transport complex, RnfABCDGE type, subunit [Pseudomonadota bacterium]